MSDTIKLESSEPTLREKIQGDNNTTNLKSFYYLEDGSITFSILSTKYATKKLDKGVYNLSVVSTNNGYELKLTKNEDRELLNNDLDFYYEDKIKNIYSKFFLPEIKQKINTLGYNHKLGILLYGKHGTGKTSMFKKYFNNAVNDNEALVFNVISPAGIGIWWDFLQKIRKVQDNPMVIFMDEFDEYFTEYGCETTLKRMLDGTDSIDNCFFMMTTNYIDKIPETIKDRPSRIKYKIEVTGIQDERLISQFLSSSFDKIGMTVDFKKDVASMKGKTIDELKQWILDRVMDIESEQTQTKKLGFGK